jgi:hypothetical protein
MLRIKGINPREFKLAVNNMHLNIAHLEIIKGKPTVIYLGYIPFSQEPTIMQNIFIHEDSKGNKCTYLFGTLFEEDDTALIIELRIDSKNLKAFLNKDTITYIFCNKIDINNDGKILCKNKRIIEVPFLLRNKDIKYLIDVMKNAGDEKKAWENYIKEQTKASHLIITENGIIGKIEEDSE